MESHPVPSVGTPHAAATVTPYVADRLPNGIEIVTHTRKLHMYQLTEDELLSIQNAGNIKTLDIALFALCGGVFATAGLTLMTLDNLTVRVLSAMISITLVSFIGTLFFGIRAWIAWREADQKLDRIKRGEQL